MMPAYETAFERETGVLTGLGAALTRRQCAAHRTGGQVDTDHELPGSAGTIADGVLGMISAPPQPGAEAHQGRSAPAAIGRWRTAYPATTFCHGCFRRTVSAF
jgi:hypothetical protein